MNKIFQIGFNKCATTSLEYLFAEHGNIRTVHWDYGNLARRIFANHLSQQPLLSGYEDVAFFSDMEAFYRKGDKLEWIFIPELFFKELDQQYPDSKFILNIRNVDDWIASRLRHTTLFDEYGHKHEDESKRRMYVEQHMECFGLSREQVIQKWRDDFESHVSNVVAYFEGRNDLLVFDINHDRMDKIKAFFNGQISFNVDRLPRKYENGVWDV
jgi:hypothetical protein